MYKRQILATSDAELLVKLKEYSESLKNDVVKKAEKLEQVGYKEYLAHRLKETGKGNIQLNIKGKSNEILKGNQMK